MNERGLHFADQWTKETVLHPVSLFILLAMALALLICSRRYAVWPFIVVACFVVPSQRVLIGGLLFTVMRLLTIVGLVRVIIRNEIQISWKSMDTAVTVLVVARIVMALITGVDMAPFVRQLGGAMDTLLIYLLFRCLVRNWSDVFDAVRGFAWISIVVAGFFIVERLRQKNVFAAMGYVNEETLQREGRFRCQGAFSHPILAGCFWATMMPLMAAMYWRQGLRRFEAFIGLFGSSVIVLNCASSTPVAAVALAMLGAAMFPLRNFMSWIRWGIVAALGLLQLVWDKPIWRLFAKVNIVGGSTGYYRYQLIDKAVQHMGEWFWTGLGTHSSAEWASNLYDVTNNYLIMGFEGGILLLLLFLAVLVVGFAATGRIWRYSASMKNRPLVYAGWALGVTVFMHSMNFFSVMYFGQILMVWALTLAMIGSLTPPRRPRRAGAYRVIQGSRPEQVAAIGPEPLAPAPAQAISNQ